jgi:hypothetical protein
VLGQASCATIAGMLSQGFPVAQQVIDAARDAVRETQRGRMRQSASLLDRLLGEPLRRIPVIRPDRARDRFLAGNPENAVYPELPLRGGTISTAAVDDCVDNFVSGRSNGSLMVAFVGIA